MKTPEERRSINNEKIKRMGIACLESLPVLDDARLDHMKSIEEASDRAVASLLSTQVACDIQDGDYENSVSFFLKLLDRFDVSFKLNSLEKKLFEGQFEDQDVINVSWEYECFWALAWALGLVDDITDASQICDVATAVGLVGSCDDIEDFDGQCIPRDAEDILDMLDLYYRYHWAVTEKRLRPETETKDLNGEVVMERRRALEWLFSDESDWFSISLDT